MSIPATASKPRRLGQGRSRFQSLMNIRSATLVFTNSRLWIMVSTLEADASTLTSAKAGARGTTTVAAGTVTLTECPDNPFGP